MWIEGWGLVFQTVWKRAYCLLLLVLWDEKSCLGVCKSKENLEVAGGVSSIPWLAGISIGLGSPDFRAKDRSCQWQILFQASRKSIIIQRRKLLWSSLTSRVSGQASHLDLLLKSMVRDLTFFHLAQSQLRCCREKWWRNVFSCTLSFLQDFACVMLG